MRCDPRVILPTMEGQVLNTAHVGSSKLVAVHPTYITTCYYPCNPYDNEIFHIQPGSKMIFTQKKDAWIAHPSI
jgi:hypothetical protein